MKTKPSIPAMDQEIKVSLTMRELTHIVGSILVISLALGIGYILGEYCSVNTLGQGAGNHVQFDTTSNANMAPAASLAPFSDTGGGITANNDNTQGNSDNVGLSVSQNLNQNTFANQNPTDPSADGGTDSSRNQHGVAYTRSTENNTNNDTSSGLSSAADSQQTTIETHSLYVGDWASRDTGSGTNTTQTSDTLTSNTSVANTSSHTANPSSSTSGNSAPGSARYVASKTGKKYYPIGCKSADRIKPANRVYYDTSDDALAEGLTASTVCK